MTVATDPTAPTQRDEIEARCRRLMAANAQIQARGWDGDRARAKRLSEIDAALDAHNEATP